MPAGPCDHMLLDVISNTDCAGRGDGNMGSSLLCPIRPTGLQELQCLALRHTLVLENAI